MESPNAGDDGLENVIVTESDQKQSSDGLQTATTQPKLIQIFLKHTNGKTIALEVYQSWTTETLKELVHQKLDIPRELSFRLSFGGRQLEDGRTLADYNVQKESTVHLLYRLLGGYHWKPTNIKG